jgi:hypothetical protein
MTLTSVVLLAATAVAVSSPRSAQAVVAYAAIRNAFPCPNRP